MNYAGIDATNGQRMDSSEHIRQSIRDILTTPIGSRIMRREYGSLLPALIDQPLHGVTRVRLYAATYVALLRWEPRIKIDSIAVLESAFAEGKIILELVARMSDPRSAVRPAAYQIALRT